MSERTCRTTDERLHPAAVSLCFLWCATQPKGVRRHNQGPRGGSPARCPCNAAPVAGGVLCGLNILPHTFDPAHIAQKDARRDQTRSVPSAVWVVNSRRTCGSRSGRRRRRVSGRQHPDRCPPYPPPPSLSAPARAVCPSHRDDGVMTAVPVGLCSADAFLLRKSGLARPFGPLPSVPPARLILLCAVGGGGARLPVLPSNL